MLSGKCPSCDQHVAEAQLKQMNLSDGRLKIAALSAVCPSCNTILGVVTDPRPFEDSLNAINRATNAR